MDFFLFRGKDFNEHFDFKNDKGQLISIPGGQVKIILERGTFGREYHEGQGIRKSRSRIDWLISKEESADFDYTTMYYTLYLNDVELVRGVLKIQ